MRIIKHLKEPSSAAADNSADAGLVDPMMQQLTSCQIRAVNCTKDKFYSKYDSRTLPNPRTVDFVKRALEAGPRDKQPAPETESQRYGWYWDVSFTDSAILNDDRLNFHHQSNPLIKLQTSVNLASKINKVLENPPK